MKSVVAKGLPLEGRTPKAMSDVCRYLILEPDSRERVVLPWLAGLVEDLAVKKQYCTRRNYQSSVVGLRCLIKRSIRVQRSVILPPYFLVAL